MPLFQITNTPMTVVEQQNFDSEKRLQQLIEANLKTVFSCRLVASEFATGALHAGRIDTLALAASVPEVGPAAFGLPGHCLANA